MRRKIRVKKHIRSNGSVVKGHTRNIKFNRRPTRKMKQAGVNAWYTKQDITKNPRIKENWWFDEPDDYIRVDRTTNWWRFRVTNPKPYERFFITSHTNETGTRIVRQNVYGVRKGKKASELQSIRYPKRYYGIPVEEKQKKRRK